MPRNDELGTHDDKLSFVLSPETSARLMALLFSGNTLKLFFRIDGLELMKN